MMGWGLAAISNVQVIGVPYFFYNSEAEAVGVRISCLSGFFKPLKQVFGFNCR